MLSTAEEIRHQLREFCGTVTEGARSTSPDNGDGLPLWDVSYINFNVGQGFGALAWTETGQNNVS